MKEQAFWKKKYLFGITGLSWCICLGFPGAAFAVVFFTRGNLNFTALFVMVLAMLICARTIEGVIKDIKERKK